MTVNVAELVLDLTQLGIRLEAQGGEAAGYDAAQFGR